MTKRKAAGKEGAVASDVVSTAAHGGINLDTVRELARIVNDFDLAEVKVDPSGAIRVRRQVTQAAPAPAPLAHSPLPAGLSLMPSPAPEIDPGLVIASPFVGTFYRSSSPEAPVFVDVGQPVRKGQVVCIVEAMKLMNEIESEIDGKIVDILVKNGDHVEYGQGLFRLARA